MNMRISILLVLLLTVATLAFFAQTPKPQRVTAAMLPTGELLSEPGPAFRLKTID